MASIGMISGNSAEAMSSVTASDRIREMKAEIVEEQMEPKKVENTEEKPVREDHITKERRLEAESIDLYV